MQPMRRALHEVRALPSPTREVAVGAVGLGVLGALLGAVLGLLAYAPTAWAAAAEVGLPTALLGAVLGPVVGSLVRAAHRAGRG